jgi:hypothetical protein
MAKSKMKTFAGIVGTFLLLCALGGHSEARVLAERQYGEGARKAGKIAEGAYPDGFQPKVHAGEEPYRLIGEDPVDVPVAAGEQVSPDAGSIVVRVKYVAPRPAAPDSAPSRETLFSLLDKKGGYILAASIQWPENMPGWYTGAPNGGLEISGDNLPPGLWGGWVPFDRKVKPGEWMTLTFTWDNNVTRIYRDGVELKAKYVLPYDPADNVVAAGRFGDRLADVRTLRIGADNEVLNLPLLSGAIASVEILDQAIVPTSPKPVIRTVADDSFQLPGISGKLVAGQTVTATLVAEPDGTATFDLGKVRAIAMAPVPEHDGGPGVPAVLPGTYRGSYTVRPGDDFEDGYVVGQFVSSAGIKADPVSSSSKWTIDTKPVVTFAIDKKELSADSATKTLVKLSAKDANGVALEGRHIKLTLATTDEYTGLVGAGDFGTSASPSVETRWKGTTDSWGDVEFEYTSGFAAKTVILQAKDLDSGGVSVDHIRAFKEASIDIALTPPISMAAARRGSLYVIKVEASRTELTADGRSRSVIRATVLDPAGNPVAGEPVAFTLSSANGTLRTIVGTTDERGVATAEYIAGKKVGIVVVTATDTARNISGNVSILLLADAPAKLLLKARPESLPADGSSRANVEVKVTDINDNPNKDTKVEFRIAKGSGRLDSPTLLTNLTGDAVNRFTAGTTPGITTILATVRSKVPTDGELSKAKNVLFVPFNAAEEEIRVEKWLKKKGDKALLLEPVVQYTVGRSSEIHTLLAPCEMTVGDLYVESWDKAEVGQSLMSYEPVVK